MSLNIETKKVAVEEISAAIANAQTLVVAEYRGISVSSMTELRANARKEGVYLRVLKNTLARRAVEGTSFAALADQMVEHLRTPPDMNPHFSLPHRKDISLFCISRRC